MRASLWGRDERQAARAMGLPRRPHTTEWLVRARTVRMRLPVSAPLGVMTGLTADGLERSAGARPREERKLISRRVVCRGPRGRVGTFNL